MGGVIAGASPGVCGLLGSTALPAARAWRARCSAAEGVALTACGALGVSNQPTGPAVPQAGASATALQSSARGSSRGAAALKASKAGALKKGGAQVADEDELESDVSPGCAAWPPVGKKSDSRDALGVIPTVSVGRGGGGAAAAGPSTVGGEASTGGHGSLGGTATLAEPLYVRLPVCRSFLARSNETATSSARDESAGASAPPSVAAVGGGAGCTSARGRDGRRELFGVALSDEAGAAEGAMGNAMGSAVCGGAACGGAACGGGSCEGRGKREPAEASVAISVSPPAEGVASGEPSGCAPTGGLGRGTEGRGDLKPDDCLPLRR